MTILCKYECVNEKRCKSLQDEGTEREDIGKLGLYHALFLSNLVRDYNTLKLLFIHQLTQENAQTQLLHLFIFMEKHFMTWTFS